VPMMRVCSGVSGDAFCGKLIPEGSKASGYKCRECANQIQRRKRARRGSTSQRGLGHEHQQLAKQVLREESVCWLCDQPARPGDPLEVDHVKPRSEGGTTTREATFGANRPRSAGPPIRSGNVGTYGGRGRAGRS